MGWPFRFCICAASIPEVAAAPASSRLHDDRSTGAEDDSGRASQRRRTVLRESNVLRVGVACKLVFFPLWDAILYWFHMAHVLVYFIVFALCVIATATVRTCCPLLRIAKLELVLHTVTVYHTTYSNIILYTYAIQCTAVYVRADRVTVIARSPRFVILLI